MVEVIKIPKISPSNEDSKTKEEERDSIPKIDIDKGKNEKKPKGKKMGKKFRDIFKGKRVKVIIGIIITFLFIFILNTIFVFNIYKKGQALKDSALLVKVAFGQQSLPKVKSELEQTKISLADFEKAYKKIAWMKFVPFLGSYVKDGQHAINAANYGFEAADIVVVTIEPYADIIGFANGSTADPNSPQETTQDRINFVIKTIPDLIPKADELSQKVEQIKKEIDEIEADRYPKKLAGYEVRSNIEKGMEMLDLGASLVTRGKPLLEQAQYLLGTDGPRRYLVIFQNDKELRPTGGFITAYSIAEVEKGKFKPVLSNDIYNLDDNYIPNIPASEPIIKYLKGPYLISRYYRLRDMNWDPDFKDSMKLFLEEAESAGIRDIDGIIAVDTQLLVYLLDVLGPIGVPGYGDFSTEIVEECDCPQVIYELESFADIEGPIVWSENEPGKIVFAPANIDNRKKIIGPLMNSILSNALGQPKDKLSGLFKAGFLSLLEKHVLFYMVNDEAQSAVESFGIAGRVIDYGGDYLHINDANLGGRKSNLYVTQEVLQEIDIKKDRSIEKILTITYKNPEKYDGWLNSVLPNWVRVYVPEGSELIFFDGVEESKDPYEEHNKTVFAGFFQLRPQGVSKVTIKYKLPFKIDSDQYSLFLQKQSGTNSPLYIININKTEEELFLKTDKELKFRI